MKFVFLTIKKLLILSAISLSVTYCGGGGIDGSGAPVENSSSASTGPISGFGSVIVNGVRYDTSSATISISGSNAIESDLEVGHYVTVIGEINSDNQTGTASEVRFQPRVIGEISTINLVTNQINVLGQLIEITNSTIFDNSIQPDSIDGLTIGQRVRVSGSLDSNHIVTATRIDQDLSLENEIFGRIDSINLITNQLIINGFVVDFSNAEIEGDLLVGANALVGGTSLNDQLIADEIDIMSFSIGDLENISSLVIAGPISDTESESRFEVNDFPVLITSETIFIGGDANNIREDVFVEISGTLVSDQGSLDGVLRADSIEFQVINPAFIFGFIEALDIQDGVIPTATFSLSGQTIQTSVNTIFEDDSDLDLDQLNASLLRDGDPVLVAGNHVGPVLEAMFIERQESEVIFDDEEIELIGLAVNIDQNGFDLFDFAVQFDEDTTFYLNDEEVSYEDIEELLETNPVYVEGIVQGNIITAEVIEIELLSGSDQVDSDIEIPSDLEPEDFNTDLILEPEMPDDSDNSNPDLDLPDLSNPDLNDLDFEIPYIEDPIYPDSESITWSI